jgi:hypothetical protein
LISGCILWLCWLVSECLTDEMGETSEWGCSPFAHRLRSVKRPTGPVVLFITATTQWHSIATQQQPPMDVDDDRANGQVASGSSNGRLPSQTSSTTIDIGPAPTALRVKIAKGKKGKVPRKPRTASSSTPGRKKRVPAPRTKQSASTTVDDETPWRVVEPPPSARKPWTMEEKNPSNLVPRVWAEVRLMFDQSTSKATFVSSRIDPSSSPSSQNWPRPSTA